MLNNFSEVQIPTNWPELIIEWLTTEVRLLQENGISSLVKLFPFADSLYLEDRPPTWCCYFPNPEDTNLTPANQLKLQWTREWHEFCGEYLEDLTEFKIAVYNDIPWVFFNKINMERFPLRPFKNVEEQATLEDLELMAIVDPDEQPRRHGVKRYFPEKKKIVLCYLFSWGTDWVDYCCQVVP